MPTPIPGLHPGYEMRCEPGRRPITEAAGVQVPGRARRPTCDHTRYSARRTRVDGPKAISFQARSQIMIEPATFQARATPVVQGIKVRHFRQIVLWPLQLMPLREDVQIQRHWDYIARPEPANPWHEVMDEFTGDPCAFQERHYAEFVNFLPHVQRVLYGEGKGVTDRAHARACESPIRVFRRSDVQGVRI